MASNVLEKPAVFEEEISMWMFPEDVPSDTGETVSLVDVFNQRQENVKVGRGPFPRESFPSFPQGAAAARARALTDVRLPLRSTSRARSWKPTSWRPRT